MNPKALDAFVLAIVGGEGPPALPGLAGHEPDFSAARTSSQASRPRGGAYFVESNFFEPAWQEA